MPCPFQIFSQSDYLIQIVDINSHTEWQTMQIQISWLLRSQLIWIYTVCKGRVHPSSAGQGLIFFLISQRKHKLWVFIRSALLMNTHNIHFHGRNKKNNCMSNEDLDQTISVHSFKIKHILQPLPHFSLEVFGKHCRPRSDANECSI